MRTTSSSRLVVDAIHRSGLVEASALRDLATSTGDRESGGQRVVERVIRAGLLTPFQVNEILNGRGECLELGSYQLIEKLGAGGMGDVYLGVHKTTGSRHAIKVLASSLRSDPVARNRFEREWLTASGLNHPNIVRVHEFLYDDERKLPYLVMEYVDGVSLQAAVAFAGTFSGDVAAFCGRQVADGLQHAWNAKLVHRDIKPANLLIDRSGLVKILDLGIVRWTDQMGLTTASKDGKRILGTVDYLAPEQAEDSSTVDCRADIYSLGATLYFLLIGQPPFARGSLAKRLLKKQHEDPEPLNQLRPDVPTGLSDVIARMLSRKPRERYPDPTTAASALARWASVPADFPAALFSEVVRAGRFDPSVPQTRRTDDHVACIYVNTPGVELCDTKLLVPSAMAKPLVECDSQAPFGGETSALTLPASGTTPGTVNRSPRGKKLLALLIIALVVALFATARWALT